MTFSFLDFAFYAFAAILIFAALMVVTVRNPVKAALFLVLAFFSAACIWITLEAEFLAIVLVLVYVGAVMVLFLFVVMMLDINLVQMREGFGKYLPVGGFVALLLVAELIIILNTKVFSPESMPRPAGQPADYSNTQKLGEILYTQYAYPFEIAAIILLVAISRRYITDIASSSTNALPEACEADICQKRRSAARGFHEIRKAGP